MQAFFRFGQDHDLRSGIKPWTSPSPASLLASICGYFFLVLQPFAVFTVSAAQAVEMPVIASNEQEFLTNLPIVLTPSRLPQPLNEAPAAVTVIDRELIRETGYRDIPAAVKTGAGHAGRPGAGELALGDLPWPGQRFSFMDAGAGGWPLRLFAWQFRWRGLDCPAGYDRRNRAHRSGARHQFSGLRLQCLPRRDQYHHAPQR